MNSREMHESESAWIGLYPINWDVKPLKQCIEQRQGGDWGDEEITVESANKDNLVCIRVADFDFQHFGIVKNKSFTVRSYDKQTIKKLKLQCGDILVEKSGGGEKTPVGRAVIFDASFEALYANFLERFRLTKNVLPKYFLYCWNTFYLQGHTRLYIKQTIGIQNLDFSNILANEYILVPSIEEQSAIVNFLDSKCAEIDALKADIEKQIETLQEYKKSVITEAVTKGLDPNVEMKISGCNWIGQIPKAWTESKVKLHLKRRTVRNPSPGNTEILSLYREYGVIPKNSRDDNHNVTSADTSKYLFVRRGDFVINKMKAWQGSVALSSYEGVVSPAYFVYEFISDQLDKQYLHYLLRSCYKDEFRRLSAGIREGQWDLSPESFSNLLLILPSLEEQIEISQYLETTLPQIDKLIRDKGNQLETLAQYKQSLIYEYVTGKKAVPANF